MTAQPVPGVTLKTAKANNIDMRYAEIGSGPLVLFCHGWPESWYSWRHQIPAVAAAGYRVRRAGHARLRRDRRAAADRDSDITLHHRDMVGMVDAVKLLGRASDRSSAMTGARSSPGTLLLHPDRFSALRR